MTIRSALPGLAFAALPGRAAAQGASSGVLLAGELGQLRTCSFASLSQLPATRRNVTLRAGGAGPVTTATTGVLERDDR